MPCSVKAGSEYTPTTVCVPIPRGADVTKHSADGAVIGFGGLLFLVVGVVVAVRRRRFTGLLIRGFEALGRFNFNEVKMPRFFLWWGIAAAVMGGALGAVWIASVV